jgi:diguanylate cyclase (GGDEF)-like protein
VRRAWRDFVSQTRRRAGGLTNISCRALRHNPGLTKFTSVAAVSSSSIGARICGFIAFCMLAGTAGATIVEQSGGSSANTGLEVRVLDESVPVATIDAVVNGSLDSHFIRKSYSESASRGNPFWLRVEAAPAVRKNVIPVLVIRAGILHKVSVYAPGAAIEPLPEAARIPGFAGARDIAYILPSGTGPIYAKIQADGSGHRSPRLSVSTLETVLAEGARQARMISLAFGALAAMAMASLLMWVVLGESAFMLYGALFGLQALYVAYFSGQGFEWPLLSYATPLTDYTWNVLSTLSAASASLFVREIADLRRFSPRIYTVFGWLSVAFLLETGANLLKLVGFQNLVITVGNALFLGAGIFTLVVTFIAWRRGSRPAGWFLIAWTVMEAFTIATTVRLLLTGGEAHDRVLYLGLPLSMVAAAVLTALGIADRLRDQRAALSEAERHAQIDSLTGVLNRRSLLERLDAACLRARARGLPIALLFIDLDHFKEINDSFGHAAGDACLRAIIPPIQAELRQSDVIGRYGGEEFVVILSSADTAAAHPIAQRILERVAAVRVTGFGESIALTCSIGVATSDALGVWGEHLIAQADAAVYAAKRSGRNRVQVAMPMAA